MKVNIIKTPTEQEWFIAKDLALGTMDKKTKNAPDSAYKLKLLKSEHSPIRELQFVWEWTDLPYWISVHLVRHKISIEHFVSSQRNDRQDNYDRNKAPQDSPVTHRCVANAQAIINISHKRLCFCASEETRQAWIMFLNELEKYEPELVKLCQPTCVYRNGLCPEFFHCDRQEEWNENLKEYRKLFKR